MFSSLVLLALLNSAAVSAGACGTVTRAEVEAATGISFGAGIEEYSRAASTCSFAASDAAVTVSITHLGEDLDLPAELRNLGAAFPEARIREVKELSARGYAMEIPGAGTQLHLMPAARVYVLISVLGAGQADRSFGAAVRIARAVMARSLSPREQSALK